MPYHGWALNGSLHPANASRRIVSITVNMPTNMMGLYLSFIGFFLYASVSCNPINYMLVRDGNENQRRNNSQHKYP